MRRFIQPQLCHRRLDSTALEGARSGACGAPHTRWSAPQLVQAVLAGVGEVRVLAVAACAREASLSFAHVGPVGDDVAVRGTTAMLL